MSACAPTSDIIARLAQLASKFFDDVYYNNAYYARVGGISNAEVSTSLQNTGWNLSIFASSVRGSDCSGEFSRDGNAEDDFVFIVRAT